MTVHQPWDPLKACIVGRSYPPEFYDDISNPAVREPMQRVARETEEDYQKLISKLEEFNVEVIRLDISDDKSKYCDVNGVVCMPPPMTPRDFSASVGDKFYMPGPNWGENFDVNALYWDLMNGDENRKWRGKVDVLREETLARYFEDLLLPGRPMSMKESYDSFRKRDDMRKFFLHFMQGIDREEVEKVIMAAEMNTIGSVTKFPSNKQFYPWQSTQKWLDKNNIETVYDQYINTAALWRIGKDLYFNYVNIMNAWNKKSFMKKWERMFPDYRVHGVSTPGHSDGAMAPVCPGLIISINPAMDFKDTFPGWEVVHLKGESWTKVEPFLQMKSKNQGKWWIPGEESNQDLVDYIDTWLSDWVTYVEESVFDVNMLSIDEHNVICNGYNKKVFDAFERYNITPHVINFRHRFFWDGGLHCITSDLDREGTLTDYFPNRS